MCMEKRELILRKSLEMLYKQYRHVLATTNPSLWRTLFKGVVKAVLEDIDCYVDSHIEELGRFHGAES